MKKLFPLSIAVLFSSLLLAQTPDLKKLDKYYAQMVKDWGVPSASIGIVNDGKLVFAKSYGVLEVDKKGKPDQNTLYAIASNSKAFTTAMIGMLVQEGKLDWNDKVRKYLPYFEMYDTWVSNEITIRDLLCHRVGLGTFSGDFIWYQSELTAEEIIRRIKYVPQAYNFRDGWGYSNLMYITAGEVIKKVTGKSWTENVSERILGPLGMNRTIVSPDDLEEKGNFATPHAWIDEKNVPIEWEDWETVAATGGLISSIDDLSKWMIFNLNHGIWNGDTLLTTRTRNTVWKPHNNFTVNHTKKNDFNYHFSAYGLGWGLGDYNGRLRVSHTGGYGGMLSSLYLIPDEKFGVVVLTNGMKSPFRAAALYAIDLFLNESPEDWSKKSLEQTEMYMSSDDRVPTREAARVMNTKPSKDLSSYVGTFKSDIYGNIIISQNGDQLKLDFEHSPNLSATLSHWHYDVFKINWDQYQAWFKFGTVKFNMDNNLKITGMDFDVPNDDIFFEELKPYKVSD